MLGEVVSPRRRERRGLLPKEPPSSPPATLPPNGLQPRGEKPSIFNPRKPKECVSRGGETKHLLPSRADGECWGRWSRREGESGGGSYPKNPPRRLRRHSPQTAYSQGRRDQTSPTLANRKRAGALLCCVMATATWFNARRRLVAFVLLGWAVLVVLGAGEAANDDQWIRLPDLGSFFVTVAGLFVLIALVRLVFMRLGSRSGFSPRKTQSLRTVLLTTFLVVLVATAFAPSQTAEEEPAVETEPATATQQEAVGSADAPGNGADDTDIVVLVVIGVVALAVLLRGRRLNRAVEAPNEHEVSLESDLGKTIDDAIHHLQEGNEPRMAVLAAYASLERALSSRGRHREPAETLIEHLSRVLAVVPQLAGPAVRLGALYELARFSDHPISNADRKRAADELARARRTILPLVGEVL